MYLREAFRDGQTDNRSDAVSDGQPENICWEWMQLSLCIVMTSCSKIEIIIGSLKITGAKSDLCPGPFISTEANAPVESAPMMNIATKSTWID